VLSAALVGREGAAPGPGSDPLLLPFPAGTASSLRSREQAEVCWLEGLSCYDLDLLPFSSGRGVWLPDCFIIVQFSISSF